MRTGRLLGWMLLSGACGGSPDPGASGGYTPSTPEAGVPTALPATSEGTAAGLCSQWLVRATDLSSLTGSSDTASLVARSDARGGVTVWIVDRAGAVTAAAFGVDGAMSGAPVALASGRPGRVGTQDAGATSDGGIDADAGGAQQDQGSSGEAGASAEGGANVPAIRDVEAVPGGWVASWDGRPTAGWITVYDAQGTPVSSMALATNTATLDLAPDGTLGVDDGATIGWIRPGQSTEQIALTYAPALAGQYTVSVGPLTAWSGGVAYVSAPDLSTNVETTAPDGATFTFPGPSLASAPCGDGYAAQPAWLIPGGDGHGAAVVGLCSPSSPVTVALGFASTAFPPRSFAFDAPVPAGAAIAGAARAASGGVVLAWSSAAASTSAPAALGLVEVAPTGARGAFVPLGQMPAAPTGLALAGSADGRGYLAIGWNGAVRAGYAARCADP